MLENNFDKKNDEKNECHAHTNYEHTLILVKQI